jgi:hypothetical protein
VIALSPALRKDLENACVRGRRAAEAGSRAAINSLGVMEDRPPEHLSKDDRDVRRALRAKRQQIGDEHGRIDLLVADCAYEQWHQLLFARFLAENHLLIHPEFGAPVTLVECGELADDLGVPDAWAVASRFAAEILPGIFRLDDPCVRLRLAPESRLELERIVESLAPETFAANDALGWVYQHWQKEQKDEVNASERKIGGADIAPVTQLFTETYMVRFLLENSLGAWWASRHPDSPLIREWRFLRVNGAGEPIAGAFLAWPSTVAEVTVIDPCCGSGHFLVEAFSMLWRMRAEEERLPPIEAQDAVLQSNLFGLELDPRCVQIAIFAVAMAAWTAGGAWRDLPVPNVACSGIPVRASADDWRALGRGDGRLEQALARLHVLFREADTLGSLIDPRGAAEFAESRALQRSLDDVDWDVVAPILNEAVASERDDPAIAVLGSAASAVARAARFMSRSYTLVATNVPYLTRNSHAPVLAEFGANRFPSSKHDLATIFLERSLDLLDQGGSLFLVVAQNWLFMPRYETLRRELLGETRWLVLARLGEGAFQSSAAAGAFVCLLGLGKEPPTPEASMAVIDVGVAGSPARCAELVAGAPVTRLQQRDQTANPDARILLDAPARSELLGRFADSRYGLRTGDANRFIRSFWELATIESDWRFHQGTPDGMAPYAGREAVLHWGPAGGLHEYADLGIASLQGADAWGRCGVVVKLTRELSSALYTGESFDNNVAVVWPLVEADLGAVWAFLSSPEFTLAVRRIDPSLKVMNATLLKVPFEIDRWRRVAETSGELPQPLSDDATQWLFKGHPSEATEPLQVAVARLLGYCWPEQDHDDVEVFADDDGIVCLPSVLGERGAADRLQELLAHTFSGTWSPARAAELLASSGSKKASLESWLRDEFFKAHCQTFTNRPFIWHVWDGRKDGFSALLNYHRLDRLTLERLAYTYLGDWIERQSAAAREDVVGAEERLIAARELQGRLALILEGESPYDIYVRWKPVSAQAVGWAPDPDDGVRLNVRPFVQAGVLRAKFNVKWDKDRGKNPDGSERHNDLHLTNAQKQNARDGEVGA